MNNDLESRFRIIDEFAHQEMTRAMMGAALSNSAPIDKVSSFLLAGLAATAGLTASNIDKARLLLGAENVSTFLTLILVAMLCGTGAKILSMRVQIQLRVDKALRGEFAAIMTNREQQLQILFAQLAPDRPLPPPDLLHLMDELTGVAPWYVRAFARKAGERAGQDPLHAFRMAASAFNGQVRWSALQLVLALVALGFVIRHV